MPLLPLLPQGEGVGDEGYADFFFVFLMGA